MNLKARLDAEFFPFVIRPARYVGNEWGAVLPVPESKAIALALCVPEKYERAMGYAEMHRLYAALNRSDVIACERAFLPDEDAARLMSEQQIPLFTLESFRALSELDWIHFFIFDPSTFGHLIAFLKLAGIASKPNDRSETDPVISASGMGKINPEPIADFLDFFFVGDLDAEVNSIGAVLTERTILGKNEVVKKLAKLPGVYVTSGEITKEPIRARVADGRNRLEDIVPIQAFEEVQNDNLRVKLPQSLDGQRSASLLADTLLRSGYDELVLDADLVAGIKNFDQFVLSLGQRLRDKHVSVYLPPLPITQHAIDYARAVTFGEKQTIRFNIISGSERLRESQGHFTSLEQFYQTLANAYALGWKSVRLELGLGLPEETERDIDETIEFLHNCDSVRREYGEKAFLIVSISPFEPKPFTEWQWDPMISPEEYDRRCEHIQRRFRVRNVQYKTRNCVDAHYSLALSRAQRDFSAVLERRDEFFSDATQSGFSIDIVQFGWIIDALTKSRPIGDPSPWDRFDYGQSREQLAQLRRSAFPPKQMNAVSGGFKLGDLILSKPALAEQILAPTPTTPTGSFGRRPKRVLSEAPPMIIPRSRIRLMWSKDESVRYVGHLATMRVFERACRRSEVPVAYSQGARPRPRLSFGPPLTLGYVSLGEFLDIQLDTPFQESMIEKLNDGLPSGFRVLQGRPVFGKATSVSSLINLACYEIPLAADNSITQIMVEDVLSQPSIIVKRIKGDETHEVDIRSSIFKIELRGSKGVNILYMELAMGNQGFVRPDEVLSSCFGLSERYVLPLKICRTALLIIVGDNRLSPFEVSS